VLGVAGNITQIVGDQDGTSECTHADGGNESTDGELQSLHISRPHDWHDSKKDENENFTKTSITIWS
jgi:hypothetical protein